MPGSWLEPKLLSVICLGLGGVVLGLWGLCTSVGRRRWWLPALAVVLAGGLYFAPPGGTSTHNAGTPIASAPILLFLGVFLLMIVAPAERTAHWARRAWSHMRTRGCQAVLWGALVVAGPLWALTLAFDDADAAPVLRDDEVPGADLADVADSPLRTDAGRTVHAETLRVRPSDEDLHVDQLALLDFHGIRDEVMPLGVAWVNCNCHGWVFAGGRFFLRGEQVAIILEDNGYAAVPNPQPRDLAVYRNSTGSIVHTGVVRFVGPESILVESKWGKSGRFLHPHNLHCYHPAECTFYRSARSGHALKMVRE